MRDGWFETPIADVAKVLSGFAFRSDLFNKSQGMPLIRIRDLPKRDSTEAFYSGSYDDRFVVKKGDFLIGMDGEFHCYEWNGPDALLNQRVCRIQEFEFKKVVPRYIYFAVNQYLDKIERDTGYTTVKHISAKQVLGITIPLPPLPEQKRIVDLISSVDSYIEALQQQLESAKRSRNAVLHELLTAGGDDWIESTLGEMISYSIGGIWGDEPGNSEVDVPVYRQTEFNDSGELTTPADALRSISKSQLESRTLQYGDILIQKSAGTPSLPGRVVMVSNLDAEPATFSNFLNLLRPDQSKCLTRFTFLHFWLKHKNGRAFEFQRGTNIKNLDLPNYLREKILLPPLLEQKRIVEIINTIDEIISQTRLTTSKVRSLRSGLLSDLLSGEHQMPATYDKFIGAA